MLDLRNIFSKKKRVLGGNEKNAPSARLVQIEDSRRAEIPRYPPFARGLPAIRPEEILSTQGELIEKIRRTLGLPVTDFNDKVYPVLYRYAAFVHLLPASKEHHHRGAGGLFRHGLEVAYWAARLSESVVFAHDGTPKDRRHSEPKWRLATCLAGMTHDVGKASSDIDVTDESGKLMWSPYGPPIHEWAKANHIDRYFLHWRENRHKRHERYSLQEVSHILTDEIRDYLARPSRGPYEGLLDAIAGAGVNEPITKMVLAADQESVKRDLKESQIDADSLALGVPVERFVIDAMRRLINTKKWGVNELGANVWVLEQGTFVTWRDLRKIYAIAQDDNMPGIPRDPDTLADILIERGFAVANEKEIEGSHVRYRYWEIMPDLVAKTAPETKLLALRLEKADLIFTSGTPAPLTGSVTDESPIVIPADEEAPSSSHTGDVPSQQKLPQVLELHQEGEPTSATHHQEKTQQNKSQRATEATITGQSDLSQPDSSAGKKAPSAAPVKVMSDAEAAAASMGIGVPLFSTSPAKATVKPEIQKEEVPTPLPPGTDELSPDVLGGGVISTEPPQEAVVPQSASRSSAPAVAKQLPPSDESDVVPAVQSAGEKLTDHLDTLGEAGSIIAAAVLPVLHGAQPLGKVVDVVGTQVLLIHPKGVQALGKPKEVEAVLAGANLLKANVMSPGTKVHDVNGTKGLVLTELLSRKIVLAIDEVRAAGALKSESKNTHGSTKRTLSPSADVTKQQTVKKHDKTSAAKDVSSKQSKKKKPTQVPAKKEVLHQNTSVKSVNYSGKKASQTTKPAQPEKNEPVVQFSLPIERAPAPREPNQASSKVRREEALSRQYELSPPMMTANEALDRLIDMIVDRGGEWLTSPVIEEGDCLKTKVTCLDRVTGFYPQLTNRQLRQATVFIAARQSRASARVKSIQVNKNYLCVELKDIPTKSGDSHEV